MDDILPTIGEFGKYQKLLVFGICLPACIPCGFCAFNQLFMADTPEDYWCKIPELLNISSVEQRKYLALPPDMVNVMHVKKKPYFQIDIYFDIDIARMKGTKRDNYS